MEATSATAAAGRGVEPPPTMSSVATVETAEKSWEGEVEAQSLSTADSTKGSTRSWVKNPWRAHTRKIFLACGIVVVPMVAFTIAIIWVVFANLINGTLQLVRYQAYR